MSNVTWRSRIVVATLVGAAFGVGSMLVACVIADPPPDLPQPPHRHPNIVHASVVPPEDQVIATWPAKFVVPVDVVDPSTTFHWAMFIDYDPLTNTSPAISQEEDPRKTALDGGVQLIELSREAPADTTRCHDIQFLVARSFTATSAHTPDSLGADVAHWFYNPSGDVGACATYDAGGSDGAFPPDAGADAGIIAPQDSGAPDGAVD